MDGLSFSVESLYFSIQSLKLLDENLNELYSFLNSIDLSGVQLSNEGLLSKGKSTINEIITDNNNNLRKRLEDTRDTILKTDAEAALLFSMLDGEFLTETGEIDSEKLMTAIVDVVSKQEDFFATAEEFSKSIADYQKKLERINEQIKVYENQKGLFGDFLTTSMDYNAIKNGINEVNDAEVMIPQLESEKEALTQAMMMLQVLRDYSLNSAFSLYTQYDDFESVVSNGRKLFSAEYNEQLKYFTSEETKIATYLLNTGATERLEQYFDLKFDVVNQRQGMEMAEEVMLKVKRYYGEDGIGGNWEDILPNAGAVMTLAGEGFFDGIDNFFDGFENLFAADGKVSADQYKTSYLVQMLQEFYGEEGFMSLFATGTYEIANSIGNMAIPSFVGTITHCPELGSFLMGLSAAGNSREQGLQSGMTDAEAWVYGTLSGASETVLGLFLGGIPGTSYLDEVAERIPGVRGYFAKVLSEGIEESTQSILDPLIAATASFVTGNEVEEIRFDWNDVLKSGVYGMITAGLLNGGQLFAAPNVDTSPVAKIKLDGETFVIPAESASGLIGKFATKDMTDPVVKAEFKAELIKLSNRETGMTVEESPVVIDTENGEGIVSTSTEVVENTANIKIAVDGKTYELTPESRNKILERFEGSDLSKDSINEEFKKAVKDNGTEIVNVASNESSSNVNVETNEGIVSASPELREDSLNIKIEVDGTIYELTPESRNQILEKYEGSDLSNSSIMENYKADVKKLANSNVIVEETSVNNSESSERIVVESSDTSTGSNNTIEFKNNVAQLISVLKGQQNIMSGAISTGEHASEGSMKLTDNAVASGGLNAAAMVAGSQILMSPNSSISTHSGNVNLSADSMSQQSNQNLGRDTQNPTDIWNALVDFAKKHGGKEITTEDQKVFNDLLTKYRSQFSNSLGDNVSLVNEADLDLQIFGEHLDRTQNGYNKLLVKQFELRFKLDSIEARKILNKPLAGDVSIENGLRMEFDRVNQMLDSIRRSPSGLIEVTSLDAKAKVSHFAINQESYNDAVDIRNALWSKLREISNRVQRGVASQIEQDGLPNLMKKCSDQADFVDLIEQNSKGDIKFSAPIDESILDVALYGEKLNRTESGLRALKARLKQNEVKFKRIFSKILIGNNFSLEQIKNFTSEIVKLDGILSEINRLGNAISSVTRSLARNVVQNTSVVVQKVAVGLENVSGTFASSLIRAKSNITDGASTVVGDNNSSRGKRKKLSITDQPGRKYPNLTDHLSYQYFGRTFTHDQQGYNEVALIRDAAWIECMAIDARIENKTATESDWERHDVVVKQYQKANQIAKGIAGSSKSSIISSSLPFRGRQVFDTFENSKNAVKMAIKESQMLYQGKFNGLDSIRSYLETGKKEVLGSRGDLQLLAMHMDKTTLQQIYEQLIQEKGTTSSDVVKTVVGDTSNSTYKLSENLQKQYVGEYGKAVSDRATKWSNLVKFCQKFKGQKVNSKSDIEQIEKLYREYNYDCGHVTTLGNILGGSIEQALPIDESMLDDVLYGGKLDRSQEGYNKIRSNLALITSQMEAINARKELGTSTDLDSKKEEMLMLEFDRNHIAIESIKRSTSIDERLESYDHTDMYAQSQELYNDAVDVRNAMWKRLVEFSNGNGFNSDLMKKLTDYKDHFDFVSKIEQKAQGNIEFAPSIDESVLDEVLYGEKLERTPEGLKKMQTKFAESAINNFSNGDITIEQQRLIYAIEAITRSLGKSLVTQSDSSIVDAGVETNDIQVSFEECKKGISGAIGVANLNLGTNKGFDLLTEYMKNGDLSVLDADAFLKDAVQNTEPEMLKKVYEQLVQEHQDTISDSNLNHVKAASDSNLPDSVQTGRKYPNLTDHLSNQYFGRTFTHDQQGYNEVALIRDAAWVEYMAINSRIENKTATESDWERHDVVVKQYQKANQIAKRIAGSSNSSIISSSLPFEGKNVFASFDSLKGAFNDVIQKYDEQFDVLTELGNYLKTNDESSFVTKGYLKTIAMNTDKTTLTEIYNQLVQEKSTTVQANVESTVLEQVDAGITAEGNVNLDASLQQSFSKELQDALSIRTDRWSDLVKFCRKFNGKMVTDISDLEIIKNYANRYRIACNDVLTHKNGGLASPINESMLDEVLYGGKLDRSTEGLGKVESKLNLVFNQLSAIRLQEKLGKATSVDLTNKSLLLAEQIRLGIAKDSIQRSLNPGSVVNVGVSIVDGNDNLTLGGANLGQSKVEHVADESLVSLSSEIGKKVDITEFSSTRDLIKYLCDKSLVEADSVFDKKTSSLYLQYMKSKDRIVNPGYYDIFASGESRHPDLIAVFDDGGSGASVIPGTKKRFSGKQLLELQRSQYDYRITINNSSNINIDNAKKYVSTLISECRNRGIDIRMKNYWERDAIILYCQSDQVLETVRLLEDLSDPSKFGEDISSVTKSFGPRKPFTVGLNEDSYYGISMYVNELPFGKKSANQYDSLILIGGGSTFSEYTGYLVKNAYNNLLAKYNNDVDKITDDEFYSEIVRVHKKYMFGSEDAKEDIPLWMNRRNYLEFFELVQEHQDTISDSNLNHVKAASDSNLPDSVQTGRKYPNLTDHLSNQYFGRTFTHDQQGYNEVALIRDAAWVEYMAINSRIENKTATESDWERHDVVVKQYQKANQIAKGIAGSSNSSIISSSLPFEGKNVFASFDSLKGAFNDVIQKYDGQFDVLSELSQYLENGNEAVLDLRGGLRFLAKNTDRTQLQQIYNQLVQEKVRTSQVDAPVGSDVTQNGGKFLGSPVEKLTNKLETKDGVELSNVSDKSGVTSDKDGVGKKNSNEVTKPGEYSDDSLQNRINFFDKYSNIDSSLDIKTLQHDILQSGLSLEEIFSIEAINSRFSGGEFTELFSDMSVEDILKLISDKGNYDFVRSKIPFINFYVGLVNRSQSLEQAISFLEKLDAELLGSVITDFGFNYSLNDIVANIDNKKFLRNIMKNITARDALTLFKDMSYENIKYVITSFSYFNAKYDFYVRICNELGLSGDKNSLLAFISGNANSTVFDYNNAELTRLLNLKYKNIDLHKTENIEILKKDLLDSGLSLTYFMELSSIPKVGMGSVICSNLFESMSPEELLTFVKNFDNKSWIDFAVRHQNIENLIYVLNHYSDSYYNSNFSRMVVSNISSSMSLEQVNSLFTNNDFKLMNAAYKNEIINYLVDKFGNNVLFSAIENNIIDFSSLTSLDLSLNDNNTMTMQYLLSILSDDIKMAYIIDAVELGYNYDANYTNEEILFGVVRLFAEFRARNYNLKFSNAIVSDFYRLYNSLYSSTDRADIVRFVDTYTLDKAKISIVSGSQFYGHSDGKVGVAQSSIVDAFLPSNLATAEGIRRKNLLVNQMKRAFPGMSTKFAIEFLKKTDIGVNEGGTGGICNYADVCNAIFEYFDKNGSEEFERIFGFPMYLDGRLNDAQLLLDMFINISGKEMLVKNGKIFGDKYNLNGKMSDYANLATTIEHSYIYRTDYIQSYLQSKGIMNMNDMVVQRMLYHSKYSNYTEENYFGSNTLQLSTEFVANDILIKIHKALKNGEHLSIAAWQGLRMEQQDGGLHNLNNGHIMSIYGIDNKGNLLVDSWGRTYEINLKQALDDGINFVIGSLDLNAIGKVNTSNYSNDKIQDRTNGNEFNSVDIDKTNSVSPEIDSVSTLSDDGVSKGYSDILQIHNKILQETDFSRLDELAKREVSDFFGKDVSLITDEDYTRFKDIIRSAKLIFKNVPSGFKIDKDLLFGAYDKQLADVGRKLDVSEIRKIMEVARYSPNGLINVIKNKAKGNIEMINAIGLYNIIDALNQVAVMNSGNSISRETEFIKLLAAKNPEFFDGAKEKIESMLKEYMDSAEKNNYDISKELENIAKRNGGHVKGYDQKENGIIPHSLKTLDSAVKKVYGDFITNLREQGFVLDGCLENGDVKLKGINDSNRDELFVLTLEGNILKEKDYALGKIDGNIVGRISFSDFIPKDLLRYTIIFDNDNYVSGFIKVMEDLESAKYKIIKTNISWPGKYYQGINITFQKGLQIFELQFHTDESFYAKDDATHTFYEIKRNAELEENIRDVADYAQKLIQAQVVVPNDAEKFSKVSKFIKGAVEQQKLFSLSDYKNFEESLTSDDFKDSNKYAEKLNKFISSLEDANGELKLSEFLRAYFDNVENNQNVGNGLINSTLTSTIQAPVENRTYSSVPNTVSGEDLIVDEFRQAYEKLLSSTDIKIQELLNAGFSLDYILSNSLVQEVIPNIETYQELFANISNEKLLEIILDERNSAIVRELLTLRYNVDFYIDLLRNAKTSEYANFILSKINSNYHSSVASKLELDEDPFVQNLKHALKKKAMDESLLFGVMSKLVSYFPNSKIRAYSVYNGDFTDYVDIDCMELLSIVISDNKYVEFLGTKLNRNEKNYYQYLNAFCSLKEAVINLKLDAELSSAIIERLNRLEMEYMNDISIMEAEVAQLQNSLSSRKYSSYNIGGIKYNIPSDIDKSKQNLTVFDINKIISTMPKRLRTVIKEVNIYDVKNPFDPMWSVAYNTANFVSAATGGNGKIDIYAPSSVENRTSTFLSKFLGKDIPSDTYETVYHEAGHCFDNLLGNISESSEWNEAITKDDELPSDYCRSSKREDFAESIAYYNLNRDWFINNFPNRAKILEQILN